MPLQTRRTDQPVTYALAAAFNALRKDATIVGSRFHSGSLITQSGSDHFPATADLTVTSATATDLPTAITLVNEIKALYALHIADGTDIHKAADSVNVIAAAAATDLATVLTLANELRTDYEAHRASTTFHYTADAANAIAALAATDLASALTLVNELKTDFNLHMASHVAGFGLALVDA